MSEKIKKEDAAAFKKHARALYRLIFKIRGYCPKANYYLAMESLHLLTDEMNGYDMGGISYDMNAHKIAATESLGVAGGGDW